MQFTIGLFFSVPIVLSAQCPTPQSGSTPCNARLMRDINFSNPSAGTATRWEYSQSASTGGLIFDDTEFAYVPTGNFAPVALGNGTPNATKQHAVTTNPNTLSPQFANIPTPNGMLVINPNQGGNDNYFSINISGLIPGCTYKLEMKLWNVVNYSASGGAGTNNGNFFKTDANNTIFNTGNTGDKGAATYLNWSGTNGGGNWNAWGNPIYDALLANGNGASATFTTDIIVPAGNSGFSWAFKKDGGDANSPIVLGIEYIRVYGCEEEKITVSTGSQTNCEDDQVTLTAQGLGPAGSIITWREGGAGGNIVQATTSKNLDVVMPGAGGTVTYYAEGLWSNKAIDLTAVICCGIIVRYP